jgi:hypothetical protein
MTTSVSNNVDKLTLSNFVKLYAELFFEQLTANIFIKDNTEHSIKLIKNA